MKHTKQALFHSIVALILCCSMLVGTTFAWFTDEVTSGVNKIQAGNLDIELEYLDGGDWKPVKSDKSVFPEGILWEPGHTEVVYLRIVNKGNLALKYQLGIGVEGETLSVTESGEVIQLSKYIHFGAVDGVSVPFANRDAARAAVTESKALTAGYTKTGTMTATNETAYMALVVYMPESVGNEANHATGADAPSIDLGIRLVATQLNSEMDSFGSDYDANAAADFFPGFQGGSAGATVNVDAQGLTTAEVGMAGGEVSAVIPAGVQLADGVNSLALSVAVKETSEANIQLSENEKMRPVDVHIEGVGAGNAVPMLITLKQYLTTGINTGALKLYHVENGTPVAMTQVANPTNHNEFSYDPATGDVTLALASFSEVAVVADTNNTWDGSPQAFSKDTNGNYLISNAGQLAYFRDIVDGKTVVEGLDPTFADKTVKLTNNITLSGVNFDPIGWGYENNDWNVGDVDGKPFKGTFDGGNYDKDGNLTGYYTIFDLKQSGWDLTNDATGEPYTYTNCGFGLFAAAANATFKNLAIYGADVRVECVETGILVGLSQGSCTYENINIHNSKVANYQRPTGGLIGEVSPLNGGGKTKITNVTIGSDVVVGSLWGDFDAPCGGVIGARWDDSNTTEVVMKDVTVGCRMDVYSDVTSAYQWYAYRRAGMLMGNTEQTAENNQHLAAARFLTCENVKVYYGNWAAYHYCQFTNQDNEWCNNYPWVRVEAGENCSAYSNPRYGVPVVNGVKVSDMDAATLKEKQTGFEELRFNQLYGGGQGVYGQPAHDGVEVVNYRYSITYVNDYQVLAIKYVTESGAVSTANSAAQDLVVKWANANIGEGKFAFGGWMNAGSTKLTQIDANNTEDIVLYPYFNNPYTARFVDQKGNVVAYCFFHAEDLTKLDATKATAEAALPNPGDHFVFDYWEVHITDNEGNLTSKETYNKAAFAGYENDVTIYPVYKYDGDVKLIPVDTDSDGTINYYQVAGYSNPNGQAMVEIPGSVNGIPVLEISGGAFSSYDGVHSIVIPADVTYIGDNAFAEKWGTFDSGETITIYYAGSYADWQAKEAKFGSNWESGISSSTRIFFLNGGDKVDVTQGYLQAEVKSNWGKTVTWNHVTTISESIIEEYTGNCDCTISTTGDTAHTYVDANGNVMKHNDAGTPVNANGKEIYLEESGWITKKYTLTDGTNTYYRYRPDKVYWEGVTIN